MREFETGATRDDNNDKIDYDGMLSPQVLEAFGRYMHKHRFQSDGKVRDAHNWKKGIPRDEYMRSAWRHFMEWWKAHHSGTDSTDAICALLFNAMGYLHEALKDEARLKEDSTALRVVPRYTENGHCQ